MFVKATNDYASAHDCPRADQKPARRRRSARRLQAATSKRFHLGEGVSIDYAGPSIGVAVAAAGSLDGEALINAADAAMYEAKRQRRG